MEPLDFGNETKLRVYQCGPEIASLKWKRHLPKVVLFPLVIADLYKLFFAYSGFIWVVLPLVPLAVLAAFQKNLNDNSESQLYQINLLKNGMQIEVINLAG